VLVNRSRSVASLDCVTERRSPARAGEVLEPAHENVIHEGNLAGSSYTDPSGGDPTSYHQALDLIRAFHDLETFGLTHVALDRVFRDIAIAPV
jgi:hypothetical protein